MSGAGAAGAGAPGALVGRIPKPPASKYACGSCGFQQELSQRDQVRCRQCGYRILFKLRTDRLAQFEAR